MFRDREDAGQKLAAALTLFAKREHTFVFGLARGGVVVAAEIAKKLSLPLYVATPRKIGAPGMPELALGAIAEDGSGFFNDSIIHSLAVSKTYLQHEIEKEKAVAKQRRALYQKNPLPDLKKATVILVDDGIATGATMMATIQWMRKAQAKRIIVAIPVAATDSLELIEQAADEVFCLHSQVDFGGVGLYYRDFSQTSDQEVLNLIKEADEQAANQATLPRHSPIPLTAVREQTVRVPIGKESLEGTLHLFDQAKGIVLFAHGSGSSRFSPRNRAVADFLNKNGLATLLIDLLTQPEDRIDQQTREFRFDIELLANRLLEVTHWLQQTNQTKSLPIGYFGSSTGAAAALIAAAKEGKTISAVVSRGGRADLARDFLPQVRSPTLLIVGGDDSTVLVLNQQAYAVLACPKELTVVPNATHLFEEPGALEEVSRLAAQWFNHYLPLSLNT
ncbi:phosphoribosyltransferase family protein [Candidatus Protochlamydia phocaeensis]|uniref:phosphoribosyltransferase family protein n=1 Tax=Candidatus Protochlamydia phocaeensis TaxID=1414722 RepID=UPI0009ABDA19|nr:phosphoribosyltransferase family protein [Candidatus Protochlamydia phocaeensis]